ncbi:quinolinate synthase NadA [Frigoriglobus tundricola]|uniref:Quinolinate synthase n=1 Tax=Frigoriglobus tundricola TaxID=2774151 RepID=A0A6M5YQ58_9BACT|nr:quinolinate synthase NadA [Frigoriglobus tundricola]QJW96177.1 Quinolinate synthetase [Frigoriglobus tundricola]
MPAIDSRTPAPAPVLDDVSAEILDLKKQLGATILAHYYQEGEIQALADITGDSLKLAREATKVDSPVIVFCGVLFMAETAKMLNPAKTVLLPDLKAGCSLVDACPADKLEHYQEVLRANDRKFQTVCYINSSAKVKALSDWVVTSGNAEDVVRNKVPPGYEILFVPDKHLGRYLQELTGRDMILWDGSCMVHEIFSVVDLIKQKKEHPKAVTIAHPECPQNILQLADFAGGTEAMIKHVATYKEPTEFLVATEANMMWELERRYPQHAYLGVPGITCSCNKCPHMARNTLEKVRDCMKNRSPEILWQPEFDKAKEVLARSLLNPPVTAPVHPMGD